MKNIILITVDALRYDHSQIVKDKIIEVLGSGIDFENAYSTGPSSTMSYVGFLSSKFPTFPDEKDSILQLNKKSKRTLLYEVLKNNGFKTYVISNDLFNRYYGYDKGIDVMIDQKLKTKGKKLKNIIRYIKGESDIPYFDAQEITELVKEIFKDQIEDNKFFMHINYMDTHTPPNISNDYIRKNFSKKEIHNSKLGIEEINAMREVIDNADHNGKDFQEKVKSKLNTYQNLYYNEILYLVEHINNLLKYFEKIGKLKDTIFIFHSDHGEYLWPEGKLLGHGHPVKNKEETLNVFYDNLVHVPLVLWGVGQKKVNKVVSLVDLSPTILEIIGLEKPSEWYGDSLFSKREKPAISEDIRHGYTCYSVRTKDWAFAYNEETKQEYLFKRYPEDKKDLSSEMMEVVEQMHKHLEIHKSKIIEYSREYLKKDINNILIGLN